MLESLRGISKTVGIKQTLKAVEKGNAKAVYLAKDADERVIGGLKELCQKNSVDILYVDSMKQLGKACDIEVDAATVAILKSN